MFEFFDPLIFACKLSNIFVFLDIFTILIS